MEKSKFIFQNSKHNISTNNNTCSTDNKGSSCCSSSNTEKSLKDHWNKIYSDKQSETLEWYEEEAKESLLLIEKANIQKNDKIVNIGAGTSTLIKSLIEKGFTNLNAVDISSVALKKLESDLNLEKNRIKLIEDDLTQSKTLLNINDIDLWHDRAAFHFFTNSIQKEEYFNLIEKCVKIGGYVILAPFNKEGVDKCSGLDVQQYNLEELEKNIGDNFKIVEHFNHIYTSPKGREKHFIYALFKRIS